MVRFGVFGGDLSRLFLYARRKKKTAIRRSYSSAVTFVKCRSNAEGHTDTVAPKQVGKIRSDKNTTCSVGCDEI